jgi:hypothetical protein
MPWRCVAIDHGSIIPRGINSFEKLFHVARIFIVHQLQEVFLLSMLLSSFTTSYSHHLDIAQLPAMMNRCIASSSLAVMRTTLASSSHVPLSQPLPAFTFGGSIQVRNSTKRGGGTTKNNRNSSGKRLGVKRYGGK